MKRHGTRRQPTLDCFRAGNRTLHRVIQPCPRTHALCHVHQLGGTGIDRRAGAGRRETGDPDPAVDADTFAYMRAREAHQVETTAQSLTTSTGSLSPRGRLEVYKFAALACIRKGAGR